METHRLWKHRSWPVLLFFAVACARTTTVETRGPIMGTGYSVKYALPPGEDREAIDAGILTTLEEVNNALSNWVAESDVSRFNAHQRTEPVTVSDHTVRVVRNALVIAEKTNGALDPTLRPLIDLWGFGVKNRAEFPSEDAIRDALAVTGYRNLELDGNLLSKRIPELTLNLSANAKGYAVDQVAGYLQARGIKRFMVEVGGEVRVSTRGDSDKPWRIGIQDPRFPEKLNHIAVLKNETLATSGDYHNFFIKDGIRYSHILDPHTGNPIKNQVASVSVIARDCMTADALATGLMVLDPDDAIALVETMEGVECLVVIRTGDHDITEKMTSGMPMYFPETP